jgi:hypothetical protein
LKIARQRALNSLALTVRASSIDKPPPMVICTRPF